MLHAPREEGAGRPPGGGGGRSPAGRAAGLRARAGGSHAVPPGERSMELTRLATAGSAGLQVRFAVQRTGVRAGWDTENY